MSLDTVVDDIREEARARAREIESAGEERAEEIVAEAEREAEEIVAEAEQAVERDIERERERTLSSAKLEAKQKRLEARRDVLEDVYDDVADRIAAIEGDRRRELTAALFTAATEEFESGATLEVYGRPEDADLIEEVVADHDAEYAGEYDCLGGVVVEGVGSRVRVNNTFDSVLEDVWEDNLQEISRRLFDQ